MVSARTRSLLPFVALAAVAVVGLVLWQAREARHAERLRLERAVGAVPLFVPAPSVELVDRDENRVPLPRYRGRVVFLNFWATWCGPCIAELPSMIALYERLDPADVAFVSIAEDDTWPPVDQFLARKPLPFDLFRDRPPRVEDPFEVGSYPTSFVIDREGLALYRFNGARDWNSQPIRDLFASLGVGDR